MAQAAVPADPSIGDIGELARLLGADLENGLTADEAQRRLAQDGPNELVAAPRIPAWRRALAQFHDPLIYLLLGAILVSLAAWVFEGLEGSAARIAADLGLVEAGAPALTGFELDQLGEAAFAEVVRHTSVYARVAPAHKLLIVGALQADGNVVAMTGEGVNDAPALKAADIGVAMGVTGSEAAKGAARMILADDNFATIVEAAREGRDIFDNIRKFLRYLLSSNMGEVLTVFLGAVGAGVIGLTTPGGALVLPLLATQILWLNLITDSSRPCCTAWCSNTPRVSLPRPKRPPVQGCRNSCETSSTPSWRTASCGCAAGSAATTSCWPTAASGAGSVRRAARGGCCRPRPTWWITSSRRCRCASGCCRWKAPGAGYNVNAHRR